MTKTVRLPTGIGVHLQTGIAFAFDRIPQHLLGQTKSLNVGSLAIRRNIQDFERTDVPFGYCLHLATRL